MEFIQKLAILSDAAKYDASCASSGVPKRNASAKGGMGSTTSMGICHSYAPDGRCISLLKILLTNFCIYDCVYCVNRHSSNVERARFSVDEVVNLTLEFYKRNYIEGLFLSSGIIRNPDYTMDLLVQVAQQLREVHLFRGYIHLKTIPDADPDILARAGRFADRLSINIELPSKTTLRELAPEKNSQAIGQSMGILKQHIDHAKQERSAQNTVRSLPRQPKKTALSATRRKVTVPSYAAGGQSTQMIVGADDSCDQKILLTSERMYQRFSMRRVYYSAFSPIPDSSKKLPLKAPPLLREHRLYQADWLMRFYQFNVAELVDSNAGRMLDLELDPKLNWALQHREFFPVDVNRAPKEALLRVPGIGPTTVAKILATRRSRRIRLADLQKMRVSLDKVRCFVVTQDHSPAQVQGPRGLDSEHLRQRFTQPKDQQLALF